MFVIKLKTLLLYAAVLIISLIVGVDILLLPKGTDAPYCGEL